MRPARVDLLWVAVEPEWLPLNRIRRISGENAPLHVCEVSCRARTERCPSVCRLGRLDGFAPSELLPVRVPRSRVVRDSTYLTILRRHNGRCKVAKWWLAGKATLRR